MQHLSRASVPWRDRTGKVQYKQPHRALKKNHKKEHEDFRASSKAKQQTSGSLSQPTLAESFARREKIPRDGKKALAITEKIAQFIVLDDQPLSVVSNVGFKRLIEHLEPRYIIPSRHYIVDKTIPQMHEGIKVCMIRADIVLY